MSNELSPSAEAILNHAVDSGDYPSRIDALEAAVELLRERRDLAQRLAESRRRLDEGEYLEVDEEGLRQYYGGLLDRARERAGVRNASHERRLLPTFG